MNNKTRSAIALLLVISFAFSGIALAASPSENGKNNTKPYVSASGSVGLIGFDLETGKPQILHDAFVVAQNSLPTRSTTLLSVAPTSKSSSVIREMYVTSTGYNSEPQQTDSTPFIAADGTYVYWGMVAANFLPFGTKIRIPDYYGDKEFVVHDRMATRYSDRVDVWFTEKSDAIKWGRRTVRIEILGN